MIDSAPSSLLERHPDLEEVLEQHCRLVVDRLQMTGDISRRHRILIGAYFTMEYAFESAALFNPSMVPARTQAGLGPGETRFAMSLRAVGEGHVSSIVFRYGIVGRGGDIRLEPPSRTVRTMQPEDDRTYDRETFRSKLAEVGAYAPSMDAVLDEMGETFTRGQLDEAVRQAPAEAWERPDFARKVSRIMWLARANYRVRFDPAAGLADLVVFPIGEAESHGMEDMRLVRFTDDDGSQRYYGTYTAFNGRDILPQLMEAAEPGVAEVHTLSGRCARNKGLALFPRKVDGRYAMIGRVDGEDLFLLTSDNVRVWDEAVLIQEPAETWEFVQIGNCGSPIETDAGWLLLTHGVGPMRRYCIGASLLDLQDPTRLIGRLREPLLEPQEDERTGYVPNVVYSCGGMVHSGFLIIPYGISDVATGFARVPLDALLARLTG